MVDAINSKEGVTWTAAVQQRFAGQPIGASASLMGHNGNRSEYLATALANGDLEQFVPTWSANVEVPDAFDSVTNWPTCSKILNVRVVCSSASNRISLSSLPSRYVKCCFHV